MSKKRLLEDYPLVCPFCDELAYMKPRKKKRLLPDKIYTLRECPMGHELWSVESIPENQAAVVDELREFDTEIKEWIKYVRESKRTEGTGIGHTQSDEDKG